jgi:hypothetical protein
MNDKRDYAFSVRCSADEGDRLAWLMQVWQCDRSQAVRHLINRAFARYDVPESGYFTALNGLTMRLDGSHE